MFTPGLFIIAKNWEQPKCSSTGEWIRQTVEYSSLKKKQITDNNNIYAPKIHFTL